MKTFLKKDGLTLKNGGYLTGDGKPVSNDEFHKAQKHAEFVITLAKLAEGKDFKGKKADSIEELKTLVTKQLSGEEAIEFVKGPKKVKQPTTEALKKEALDFVAFQQEGSKAEKVNAFLQQFKVISEFEEFGLFFEQNISKLTKIYSMKEVITAVNSMIDNLD